jgi:hypothetical protein
MSKHRKRTEPKSATRASGKRSLAEAEERAKAAAKTPAEKRAAAAGNLPAKSKEAKALAAKAPPPPPVRRPATLQDAWREADDLTRRIGEQYVHLGKLDVEIKALKKRRDATDEQKEALVRQLLDLHGDMRSGQGRLEFKPETSTAAGPVAPVKPPEPVKGDAPKPDAPKGETKKDDKAA